MQITESMKALKRVHIQAISSEYILYKKKRDEATFDSSRYISIIVDGTHQSAYGKPHFTVHKKVESETVIKVRLD